MERFNVPSPARAARLGASLLIGLLSLFSAMPAHSSSFALGDLYLLSPSLPNGAITRKGVLRIDAVTGTSSLLVDLTSAPGLHGTLSYDAFRDRLLYATGATDGGLFALDAAGVSTALLGSTTLTPSLVAARGDGMVYFWYATPEGFSVMDASGTVSDLLDQTGTTRFGFGKGMVIDEIFYVSATNSLLCLTGSHGTSSPCADGTHMCVLSLPLNAAGTQLSGPVSSSQFTVSSSFETVVGAGLGPSPDLLVTVDTNSNAQEPRMLLVDPSTLAISVFASNGNYNAAATNAGAYSHRTGRAIIVDTLNDSLRTFAQGETGRGTAMGPGVSSSGGSNETDRLIEIDPTGEALAVPREAAVESSLRFAPPLPNPFRTETLLRWAQPAAARVTLAVFDISGRKVRTLVEAESFPAGEHEARWDGRTSAGLAAPAGLYHAVLTVDGKRETRPLVRLR